MARSRFIRASDGRIQGRIDQDESGFRAYGASGNYVGRYDPVADKTYDSSGRLVTVSGDALASLIFGHKTVTALK